jgi:site-specific DNA-methyltransferase (adenine-specific)
MDRPMTDPLDTITHATLYHGNNMDILPTLPDNSVDAVITDPPYELGFMGKSWDASGIAYNVELWREVLRVLKPGGHLCAFGGTRTYHRMACAIEDAGFEIRDSLHWIYGSGFPKSHNVAIAIDKEAGAMEHRGKRASFAGNIRQGQDVEPAKSMPRHEGVTDAARQWDGWGTALKPAHEPIVLARKPFNGTVAANVLQHGTGALNINATRIPTDDQFGGGAKATSGFVTGYEHDGWTPGNTAGRWPANVIVDDTITDDWARYFYCAKPSRTERNAGLDELPEQNRYKSGGVGGTGGQRSVEAAINATPQANFHPTVKPLALMQWLIRLVTPPNGTILDPFAGSGTTLAAATLEGQHAIGIELTDDYLPIITARCNWAETQTTQRTLFDTHD